LLADALCLLHAWIELTVNLHLALCVSLYYGVVHVPFTCKSGGAVHVTRVSSARRAHIMCHQR
jgi:hypothetical protein